MSQSGNLLISDGLNRRPLKEYRVAERQVETCGLSEQAASEGEGGRSYLEGRGRVWVHLDQGSDQNHAGEISGSFAGG